MSEREPLYQIAADTAVNDNGETCVILFGDSGVPDVILCDGETYRPERTCKNESKETEIIFSCSQCLADFINEPLDGAWNYCPNCGAKVIQNA